MPYLGSGSSHPSPSHSPWIQRALLEANHVTSPNSGFLIMVGKTLQGGALCALHFFSQLCLPHWPCFPTPPIPKLLSASSVASAGPAAWNAIAPELVWAGGSFVRFQLKCSFPWEPPPSLASLFSLSSNFPASSHLCNYWFINLFLLTGKFREGRNSLSLLFSAISPEPSPGPGTEGTLICLLGKSVLTKGRNYWQRKRGNVPIWCFGFMLTVC